MELIRNPVKQIILIILLLTGTTNIFSQTRNVNVVYIGDSITEGAGISSALNHATVASNSALQQLGFDTVRSSNQGHSGYTTVDFLPGTETFRKVEQDANRYKNATGVLVFSIMLGTNDSAMQGPNGSPVSKENYYKNLEAIINALLKDYPGCKVVIHHSLWYSPNTYNGARYLQEGLDRLQSYFPQIDQLVKSYSKTNKDSVFLGDTKALAYFKKNYLTNFQPENGHEGTFYLHPNATGAKALGIFWAKGMYKAVR